MTKANKPDNKQSKKLSSKDLQQAILNTFKQHPKKRYSPKDMLKQLQVGNHKDAIQQVFQQLAAEQKIIQIVDDKFCLNRNVGNAPTSNPNKGGDKSGTTQGLPKELEGYVDMTRSGSAFIISDASTMDVFVPSAYMGDALHGDKVIVKISPRRGKRPEGSIKKVLERATSHFMGVIKFTRKAAIVVPNRENIPLDIYVKLDDTLNAKDGDTVIVKVIDWENKQFRNPVGEVTAVVNNINKSDLEMQSILVDHGFPLSFDKAVMEEANALATHITEQEIAKRRDCRDILTFTIDPEDAKDFDDAISIRQLPSGDWEIGVHIADVSHYVKPDTALDKEAYRRSTSVYLVDRVSPMLPEQLSNVLCSLRPLEDKLTYSAIFTFDIDLKIIGEWFGRTVIHSDHRFTYEGAQEVLETGEGKFAEELRFLNKLAYKLRKKRFKDGAIAFETEEVKFRLDEHGVPIEAYVKERKDAHMLVEDFMLLANRAVATYIHKKSPQEIPFVYRIHDSPDLGRIADFALFAKMLGVKIAMDSPKQIAESFNNLAKAAEQDPTLKLLEPLAIRTMAKAVYSTNNIGHYGLAFEYYTHFTSPIRRYSDVLVHRLLDKNIGEKPYRVDKDMLEAQCKHISNQERKAMDAERESIKYKQVEFLTKHLGDTFDGLVSGIIDRGLFVELLNNKCEGMVGFDTLNDTYEFEVPRLRVKGKRTGHTIKVGDPVRVRITAADLNKRQVEMVMVQEEK